MVQSRKAVFPSNLWQGWIASSLMMMLGKRKQRSWALSPHDTKNTSQGKKEPSILKRETRSWLLSLTQELASLRKTRRNFSRCLDAFKAPSKWILKELVSASLFADRSSHSLMGTFLSSLKSIKEQDLPTPFCLTKQCKLLKADRHSSCQIMNQFCD